MSYSLVERFDKIVGYSTKNLLSDYVSFIDAESSYITAYFSGDIEEQPTRSFNALKTLKIQFKTAIDCVSNTKNGLDNLEYFDVVESIEDAYNTLCMLEKYGKFSRTGVGANGYSSGQQISTSLHQGQTMEDMTGSFGFDNPDNQWADIAIKNAMAETSYTTSGSGKISIPLNSKNNSITVNGVVDYQSTYSAYGKDVNRKITIKDTDLLVLGYKETMVQSAEILSGMAKGDNPEFKEDGIDPYMIYNTATSGTSYPSIIRQIISTFGKDDCFSSVEISDIKKDQDMVSMDIDVITVLGDTISTNTQA